MGVIISVKWNTWILVWEIQFHPRLSKWIVAYMEDIYPNGLLKEKTHWSKKSSLK